MTNSQAAPVAKTRAFMNTRELAFTGLLGALAAVLLMLNFPIPYIPSYMEFDFCAIPEIIGGMLLGPVAGALIVVLKLAIKLMFFSTSTQFIGELSNLIVSLSFVLPASTIYALNKTKKGAVIGIITGIICCVAIAVISNLYLIFPLYGKVLGFDMPKILAMSAKTNPMIKNPLTLAVFCIIPFNLLKTVVAGIVTFLVYKRISRPVKQILHSK